MKKLLLSSVAALSLIMITAQAEGPKCGAGKCGGGMMQKQKMMNGKKMHKMHKMRMNSPFLIKHGLPHLTKILAKSWDDPKLALTADQKAKLLEVRKTTMTGVKKLKPEVMKLRKEIIEASNAGSKAADLKAKVDKLAALEAEATMVHLNCIDSTKAVLSKEQYDYLMQKRKAHMQKRMNKMKQKGMMKCASGKCGGKQ